MSDPATMLLTRLDAAAFPCAATLRPDGWVEITVKATELLPVCRRLRHDLGFNYLSAVTALDLQDQGFRVLYHLITLGAVPEARLVVKVDLPARDMPVVPSVTAIWPTADWHEREAYDLMGIRFTGHPNLRRILLLADWAGHPLRKDYVDTRPSRPRLQRQDDPAHAGWGGEHDDR